MNREGGAPPSAGGGLYGRRKGKRLRQAQEDRLATLLPRLRLAAPPGPLPDLFPGRPTRFRLEIGFGGGEHLAAEARAHRDVGFIGCEPFVNGVAKFLGVVADEQLANVRLWDRDAAELLPLLPAGSLERVFLLYPDPWPKRRQRKRRFVSPDSLAAIARVLVPRGLFRFATDIDDYAGWTLARALRSPDLRWTAERPADWSEPWEGWQRTRYEAKALREGRRPSYLTFERV